MLCVFILLLFESRADEIKVPNFAFVQILPKGHEDLCEDLGLDEIINYCDSNPEEEGGPERCKAVMSAYKGFTCIGSTETDTISTTLTQIDKSIEFLFITNEISNNVKIDFNKLPSRMIVMLEMADELPESRYLSIIKALAQTKFDGTQQGIIDFATKIKKSTNKNTKNIGLKAEEDKHTMKLVGNIKDKVSFLIAASFEIEVVESDLNIHTLFMYGATLSPSSQFKVKTTYFVTECSFSDEIVSQLKDHSYINSKYYQLYGFDGKITINFEKDSLTVIENSEEGNEPIATVPYDIFEKAPGIISSSGDVILNAGADSIVHDNFNMTFTTNLIFMGPLGTFDYESLGPREGESNKNKKIPKLDKNKIVITKSGDYWNGNKKPKIVINADSNFYDIDTKDIDDCAEISRNPMYVFGDKVEDDEDDKKNNNKKLSTGQIVGIVIGCVAFVAIVVVVVVIVVLKTKKNRVNNK